MPLIDKQFLKIEEKSSWDRVMKGTIHRKRNSNDSSTLFLIREIKIKTTWEEQILQNSTCCCGGSEKRNILMNP